MPAWASWGAGFHGHICRDRHSQRRLWRGVALGPPGPTKPEEVLSGAASGPPGPAWPTEPLGGRCSGHRDLCSQRRPWWGQGSGLGPMRPTEALAAAGPMPGTFVVRGSLGGDGAQARDPSRLAGA